MIKIAQNVVTSILAAMPKRDPRKVLLGMFIERNADGKTATAVATDGKILSSIVFDPEDGFAAIPEAGIVIPRATCDAISRFKAGRGFSKNPDFHFKAEDDCKNGCWQVHAVGMDMPLWFMPVEGKYPQWRNVITPQPADGIRITLGSSVLAGLLAVAKSGGYQQAITILIDRDDAKKACPCHFKLESDDAPADGIFMQIKQAEYKGSRFDAATEVSA